MYHTFQATTAAALKAPGEGGDAAGSKHTRPPGSRRITTTNACVECRRRKIRCDGVQPCGQCLWYQHPEACSYAKPAQRVVPSRKLVEKLQGTIDQQRLILERLFPGKEIDKLNSIPREELLSLALTLPAPSATSPSDTVSQAMKTPGSDDSSNLEAALEGPADGGSEDEEIKREGALDQAIADSVNGLSFDDQKSIAYVGVSSIPAAMKVMVLCAPIARNMPRPKKSSEPPERASSPPPVLGEYLPDLGYGLNWLDHYFEKVHPFFPMVDEEKLRKEFTYNLRRDSAWMALINIVLALGCLASSKQSNDNHLFFFQRARKHLGFETFESRRIEALQAIGIMSGYYMHWLNRPEEATALMGAALRMATGLGLHREYSSSASHKQGDASRTRSENTRPDSEVAEMRRRTWWSLFCLDVWASTTTSRPSLGRISPAVSVLPPGKVSEEPGNTPHRQDLRVLPLTHNVDFCRIATRIQDTLATTPLLAYADLETIDNDLLAWRKGLPDILTNFDEECEEFLRRPRLVMKWRYQNLRIVLHRPFLLSTALKRIPFTMLSAEEKVAVSKIRVIAAQTIKDMSQECTEDLILGWNAVWFCFQACMVPLVSLCSDLSNMEEVEKWQGQIEMALEFFERMKDYSVAASESKSEVARWYQASRLHLEEVTRGARSRTEAQEAWHQHVKFEEQNSESPEISLLARALEAPDRGFSQSPFQMGSLLQQQHQQQQYAQPAFNVGTSAAQYNPYLATNFGQALSQPHFVPASTAPASANAVPGGMGPMGFWPAQQHTASQPHQHHQYPPLPMTDPSGPPNLALSEIWDTLQWDGGYQEVPGDSYNFTMGGVNEYQSPDASIGSGVGVAPPAGTAQRTNMVVGMGSSRTGVQGAWGLG
ncbi:fungal-specific transcription factor domain-containing protein [Phyllosticta capitalensis]|uniref:fungal-specific transcription factor domain-containing protein n=1 Tax=Phyllosticta capitalensis TaxID=121624 RepID=UPI00312DDE82